MTICVFTDVHANLPALKALLDASELAACRHLIHLGDAIGIGPHPAECLDLLLAQSSIDFVMGNHDEWFAHGLPHPQPDWMSDGERAHQHWTHSQLNPSLKAVVADWPYSHRLEVAGSHLSFVHYPRSADDRGFKEIVQEPSSTQLNELFETDADPGIIFYGHHHPFSDIKGLSRYINPGSLGCHDRPEARYTLVDVNDGILQIEHHSVPYDDLRLKQDFARREVPEHSLLNKIFFGGRLDL